MSSLGHRCDDMNLAGITRFLFCGGSEMKPLRSGFRTCASTLAPALGHPWSLPTPNS